MSGDPDVHALLDEQLETANVVRADFIVGLERELLGLDVDALAQADVLEAREIALRPPQVRLEDDADVLVALGAERPVELERSVGGRRVLHVDPHEVPARGCVSDDSLEALTTELEIELEPEPRQLHRHIRLETLGVDPREHVVILAGDRPRLVGAS